MTVLTALAGTRPLLRLALRRDRVQLPAWVGGCALVLVATAVSFADLYPTHREQQEFAASIGTNTAFRTLYGQLYDVSIGGIVAWRLASSVALVLGLMNVLLVVRHTRGEEESGRVELVEAGSVHRAAPLVTAVALVGLADVVFGVLATCLLVAQGLPVAGSAAIGAAIASNAWVFAGVAALAAQVALTGRAAAGLAGAVLGLAYVLRAIGNASGSALVWFSPLGWAEQVRAFAPHVRWWVPGMAIGVGAVLAGGAAVLAARRDLGAGLLANRAGPAEAARSLSGSLGLAWRLQRGVLLGWTVGFAALGATLGAIAKDVGTFLTGNPQLSDAFQRVGASSDLVDAYLASMLSLFGFVAAGYAIQATLRIRAEEVSQRAEPVLAAAVSRWRWAGSHFLCAAVGTAVVMLSGGTAVGLAHGLRIGDVPAQLPRLAEGALAQVPAAWVLGAVALALIGLAPREAALSWAVLAGCLLLGQIGELLKLPQWSLDLSPFAHSPAVPVDKLTSGPELALTAVAIVLGLAGLIGLRRRDLL